MRFLPTPITGAWLVEPEARADARGSFARLWCRDEFAAHGLRADFVQCNASFNVQKGTLRGLHYQAAPHGEIKLVSCVRGRVFDVLVDMRPDSPTFRAVVRRGTDAGEPAHALRARGMRPRLPHARGRQRGDLSGHDGVPPGVRTRTALERSGDRHRMADDADRDLRQGPGSGRLL